MRAGGQFQVWRKSSLEDSPLTTTNVRSGGPQLRLLLRLLLLLRRKYSTVVRSAQREHVIIRGPTSKQAPEAVRLQLILQ